MGWWLAGKQRSESQLTFQSVPRGLEKSMHLNPPILCLSEAGETLPQRDNTSLSPHHDKVQQTHTNTNMCIHTCTGSVIIIHKMGEV